MFGFLKKKENKESSYTLGSPAKGKTVPLSEVNDPTFAEEMLGKGVAVIPAEGRICAPADGKIDMVFDTLHAVSMVMPRAKRSASSSGARPVSASTVSCKECSTAYSVSISVPSMSKTMCLYLMVIPRFPAVVVLAILILPQDGRGK